MAQSRIGPEGRLVKAFAGGRYLSPTKSAFNAPAVTIMRPRVRNWRDSLRCVALASAGDGLSLVFWEKRSGRGFATYSFSGQATLPYVQILTRRAPIAAKRQTLTLRSLKTRETRDGTQRNV